MSDSSSSPEVSVSSQSLSLPPPGVTLHPSASLRSSSAPSPLQGDGGVARQLPPRLACHRDDEHSSALTDGVGSGRSVSGECCFLVVAYYRAFIMPKPVINILIFFVFCSSSVSSGWCVRWRQVSMVSSGIAPSLQTVSWRPQSMKKCVLEPWKRRMERCKPLPRFSQTQPHVDTPLPKSPPASISATLHVSSRKILH